MSVAEAAQQLGVRVQRIHQRIADGSLRAERIGSQWVVDAASVSNLRELQAPGRPLSERSAWALLACSRADNRVLDALAPAERSRARDRLSRLLARCVAGGQGSEEHAKEVAVVLRSWLRNRAKRRLYRASPRDLPDLRNDDRIALSGLSHPNSGIASGDLVEGYVAGHALDAIVDDYLLSPVSDENVANVVLHIASDSVPDKLGDIAPLLLAADLAEHRRPREEARASELLRELVQRSPQLIGGRESRSSTHGKDPK